MTARIHNLLQRSGDEADRKLGVVGASFFSMLTRMAQVLLQFLTIIILARFLTPSDFGLYGMATPLVAFFLVMRDAGLGMATLQCPTLSERQASTLFYTNVMVGICLSLAFFLCSGLVAAFYGEARLVDLINALSIMFLFSGVRVQLEALVFRDRRFRAGFIMEIVASSTALLISSGIALSGLGYWALCGRQLAYEITYTSALFLYVGWLPRSFSMDRQTFSLFKFGVHALLSNFLVFFVRNIDNVLIGWRFGPAVLGPYALGYRTVLLPIQQIVTPLARVFIPHLSQHQHDQRLFAQYYTRALQAMMFFAAPPLCGAWICTREAIDVLLGPQWEPAVPIMRWLIPAAILQAAYLSAGWLNFARGRADRQLRWGLLATPVIVGGFAIGLYWGAVGVAASYSITNALLLGPLFVYAAQGTAINVLSVARALAPVVLSAAAVSVMVLWVRNGALDHGISEAGTLVMAVAAMALTMLVLSPTVFGWTTLRMLTGGLLRRRGEMRR